MELPPEYRLPAHLLESLHTAWRLAAHYKKTYGPAEARRRLLEDVANREPVYRLRMEMERLAVQRAAEHLYALDLHPSVFEGLYRAMRDAERVTN